MILHLQLNKKIVLKLFYSSFVFLYVAAIRVASLFNPKAKKWIRGRRQQEKELDRMKFRHPLVWMHCASLGEFEQGRPVLELLKSRFPAAQFVVTFFSPSGYEVRKTYALADQVLYLPLGSKKAANRFIEKLSPDLVLWIKYEYWFQYLQSLHERQIPVLLISGIFRKDQPFFKWYGSLHREMLQYFQHLFLQDQSSADLIKPVISNEKVSVSGDTRFDRVLEITRNNRDILLAESFSKGHFTIVAGSTWPEDEEELVHFARANPAVRFILAPHQVDEDRIADIEKLFPSTVRFSVLNNQEHPTDLAKGHHQEYATIRETDAQVLIIDNIGMLSVLYKYAGLSYVGGGFGDDGVHNVLEAAVYGVPVIFGPVFEKYREALQLVESGGGFSVDSALELEELLTKLINDEQERKNSGRKAREYVINNAGATASVISFIERNGFLEH